MAAGEPEEGGRRLRKRKVQLHSDDGEAALERLLDVATSAEKIVVFSGSGLSASSGMSTFSTRGGLYERAQKKYKLADGKMLFTYAFFDRQRPEAQAFFSDIYSEAVSAQPAAGHHALRQLFDAGRLHRHYTLNIDGLAEQVGMDTWHHEHNTGGVTVEMHGNVRHLVCPECHTTTPVTAALAKQIRAKQLVPCTAPGCEGGTMRFKVMMYDDGEAECITPDDVMELMEADVKAADLVLWVGISFQQSASTLYFRKVRCWIQEAGRLDRAVQALINPSDEALFNLRTAMSNQSELRVLEVLAESDEVLPLLADRLRQQGAGGSTAAALAAAVGRAQAAAAAAAAHRAHKAKQEEQEQEWEGGWEEEDGARQQQAAVQRGRRGSGGRGRAGGGGGGGGGARDAEAAAASQQQALEAAMQQLAAAIKKEGCLQPPLSLQQQQHALALLPQLPALPMPQLGLPPMHAPLLMPAVAAWLPQLSAPAALLHAVGFPGVGGLASLLAQAGLLQQQQQQQQFALQLQPALQPVPVLPHCVLQQVPAAQQQDTAQTLEMLQSALQAALHLKLGAPAGQLQLIQQQQVAAAAPLLQQQQQQPAAPLLAQLLAGLQQHASSLAAAQPPHAGDLAAQQQAPAAVQAPSAMQAPAAVQAPAGVPAAAAAAAAAAAQPGDGAAEARSKREQSPQGVVSPPGEQDSHDSEQAPPTSGSDPAGDQQIPGPQAAAAAPGPA